MQFYYHQGFKSHFNDAPPSTQKTLYDQLDALMKHGITHLAVRQMTNEDETFWELWIDGQYQLTFIIVGDSVVLRCIGTNETYRKP